MLQSDRFLPSKGTLTSSLLLIVCLILTPTLQAAAMYTLPHLVLTILYWGSYCNPHFLDIDTEKEHLAKATKKWNQQLNPGQWDPKVCALPLPKEPPPTVSFLLRLLPILPRGSPFLPL